MVWVDYLACKQSGFILYRAAFFVFSIVVVCLFCLLFYLLICSSFIPLLALYLIFTRFCDTRCELLGMIRCHQVWLVIILRYDMIRCMTNYDCVTTA